MASHPTISAEREPPEPVTLPAPFRLSARESLFRRLLPAHRIPVIAKTPLLVALGCFLANGSFRHSGIWMSMALASLLWTTLYIVNESTDLKLEQGWRVRRSLMALLLLLPIAFCAVASLVSLPLSLLFVGMTAGQFLYCVPPIRLKRYWWVVLLLSGTLNPALRLHCGAIWGTHSPPLLAYGVCILLHLGATIRSRTLQRRRDILLGYHIAPERVEFAGLGCCLLGLAGVFWLCLSGTLPFALSLLAIIASGFTLYAWSNRVTSVQRLRQGWILFALLSLLALAILLLQS